MSRVTIEVEEFFDRIGWMRRTLHSPTEHEGFKRARRLARRRDFRLVRVEVQYEPGGKVSRFTLKTRFPRVDPRLAALSSSPTASSPRD